MSSFPWTCLLVSVLAAFLCGSVPFGYLIGKLNKVDLRKCGSGNIGATNVWRVLGKGWGTLAFLLDFLKGFLPVLLLSAYFSIIPALDQPKGFSLELILVAAALAAILGHNFTPWLGFKGGKGIATSAGVLAALLPISLGVIFVVWAVFFAIWRIVSVASMAAAIALPIATWFFYPGHFVLFGFTVAATLLTLVRHQANIGRLFRGEEKRIGSPKK
jgi:glycerol-3-phosphate acyltransferase PlsY